MAKSSFELAAATHTITLKPGKLTFVSIVAAAADATVSCYDVAAAGDIATTNKMVAFSVDVDVQGFQGGGNISDPIDFSKGLVVVVAGAGAVAYIGYKK